MSGRAPRSDDGSSIRAPVGRRAHADAMTLTTRSGLKLPGSGSTVTGICRKLCAVFFLQKFLGR